MSIVSFCAPAALAALLLATSAASTAHAADVASQLRVVEEPAAVPSPWTFRFTPYGWLTSLNGTQTVRGRSVNVDASFLDVIDATLGSGGTLIGLMADFEARNGPVSFLGDVVWTKIAVDRSGVRSRSLARAPGVVGSIGATTDLKIEMAIVEAGAAYEVARFGLGSSEASSVAVDVLAGGRFWHQKAELTLDLAATLDIGDLEVSRNRAFARSGSVDWADPFVGARLRYSVAPGHELFVRGDVGGFGVGSDFSWQAVAGYAWDFAVWNGVTLSGVLGYKALYVDYAHGEGRSRYEFDMLQHGPLLGVSMRF
jgi:hypothetical protein